MPFDDAKLEKQVGFLVLNLWRLAADKDDLTAKVKALQPEKKEAE